MGVVTRQGIKGSIAAYLGIIVGAINILFLFPLISAEALGLYRVIIDSATLLSVFAILGSGSAAIRFFPYFKDVKNKHNGYHFLFMLIPFIGFILVLTLYLIFQEDLFYLFKDKSPLLNQYSVFILPVLFSMIYMSTFSVFAQSMLRVAVPEFLSRVVLRGFIFVILLAVYFSIIDLDGMVYGIVVSYALIMILSALYLKFSLKEFFILPRMKLLPKGILKKISSFSSYMLLGSSSNMLVSKIDVIMIGSMQGLTQTGIYALSFYLGAIIEIPSRLIAKISFPLIATAFKEKDHSAIKNLYKKTAINQMLVGGILATLICVNIDNIFQLIPNKDVFESGKYVIVFIALAKFFDMSLGINVQILVNSKYYKWNIFLMPLLAVLGVITNLLLIPKFGITGAAMATLISLALVNFFRSGIIYLKSKMHPFSIDTLKGLAILACSILVGIFFPTLKHYIVDLMCRGTLVSIVYLILLFWLLPQNEITILIKKQVRKLGIKV